jgi:hypothetical protein
MIPKGISHTSAQNPTYELHKRNIKSIQEIVSSSQNYQGLSFLPVTLTGLADLFAQLGSEIDSFVGNLCISFVGLVARYVLVMQGGPSSNPGCYIYHFFRMTFLGAQVQSWFS